MKNSDSISEQPASRQYSDTDDSDVKHPGTAGLMPVKGTTCGLRPNLDEMSEDTEFDFSMAKDLKPY